MASSFIYHPASSDVELVMARGPLNLRCWWAVRGSDNVASSGVARERVIEHKDLMISFEMPHMVIADDIEGWATFEAWATEGGSFKFYPDRSIDYWMTCVAEDLEWGPARTARKKYGQAVKLRVLDDGHQPASPVAVLRRFYGINS